MSPALNDDTELHRIKEAYAHHGDHVQTSEELANIAGVSTEKMQGALGKQFDCQERYPAVWIAAHAETEVTT